jgi:hypothetical protein
MPIRSLIAKERARRKRARPENRAKENAKRDYKKEHRLYGSSKGRKLYRAELNRTAHAMGHYGNTPKGKDLIHKNGRIVGLGDRRKNRAEGAYNAAMSRIAARRSRRRKRRDSPNKMLA